MAYRGKTYSFFCANCMSGIVNAAKINELFKTQLGRITKNSGYIQIIACGHFDAHFATIVNDSANTLTKTYVQILLQGL